MSEKIKKGDKVKVEYTGKLSDGKGFDSSQGRAPLCFEVGGKQVIAGFDQAVEGMKLNEEKTFTIPVDQAYGPIRAELVQEVAREKMPKKPEPEVGMMLMLQSPDGHKIPARITKVNTDKVSIDLNHPLAGQDLTFEVKVVGINEPEDKNKKEECGCGEEKCDGEEDECNDGCECEKENCKDEEEESCGGECSCGCNHQH